MSAKPVVKPDMPAEPDDLVVRIKPQRAAGPASLSWLNSKVAVAVVLASGAIFVGVMYMALHDAGSFSRRKIEFPPLPQLNAAIAAAQERLKVNPQDITTLVELGTLHFEKGKEFYPDSINELEEARELGALDPRIFYCLGIMYQEVGLYSFALEEYKRFLRHYPEDKEIRMLEAKLLYKQGNFPEAIGEYERLKFHYPSDTLIEENLGLSLWAAKSLDRAVESFTLLKSMGGDQGRRAGYYLGQIAFDKGQSQEALQDYLSAQGSEPNADFGIPPDQFHAALASTYQKLGQPELAKPLWEQVVAESTGDPKAKALKALAQAKRDAARRVPPPSKKPTRPAKK
ncbi:MAG: tetratricopeptide repeat protein [Elusimicrobia bacterium]|nr:tetratricopeptide repeat protein [Elusimicrobiota bacterium]